VTDVTVGLRRIPVGFHVSVRVDGVEWRTANKSIAVDASMIEWKDIITLYGTPESLFLVLTRPFSPLPRSANVHFRIGASFEFAPVLGNGTSLRELDVSVEELLDRSEAALRECHGSESAPLGSSHALKRSLFRQRTASSYRLVPPSS
jgi:hypothetical protein